MRYPSRVMRVLKENWIWILAPIVLFTAVVLFLYLSGGGGGDDPYTVR